MRSFHIISLLSHQSWCSLCTCDAFSVTASTGHCSSCCIFPVSGCLNAAIRQTQQHVQHCSYIIPKFSLLLTLPEYMSVMYSSFHTVSGVIVGHSWWLFYMPARSGFSSCKSFSGSVWWSGVVNPSEASCVWINLTWLSKMLTTCLLIIMLQINIDTSARPSSLSQFHHHCCCCWWWWRGLTVHANSHPHHSGPLQSCCLASLIY